MRHFLYNQIVWSDKMKSKKVFYIVSFLTPIIILSCYIGFVHGNLKSFLINDFNEQYIFLFDYWKQILNGTQSIFYSFQIGLGESFLGTYAYYLASPLNWLFLMIPPKSVISFASILILFKIGVCSLNMFIYLKNTNKNKESINLVFAICYALMGFNITYYFNTMWLDIVLWTPLVILGIEKLMQKGDWKLYSITLFISIISQYYMAFMLCIFCVLYFFYKSYSINQCNRKTIKKFIATSLLTGLLTSFFTVPIIFHLMNVYRDNMSNNIGFIEKLSHLLMSLGIRRQTVALDYNAPLFYCGLIQFVLCLNCLLFEKNKRKKRAMLTVMVFFVLSILLDDLILFWHGGSYPYGLLYRFSFLISFFLISISAAHYQQYQPFTKKQQLWILGGYLFLLFLGYQLNGEIHFPIILINVVFFISNLLLLNIHYYQKNKIHEGAIIVFVLLELIFFIKCNFAINENLRTEVQTTLNNNRLELYDYMKNIGDNTYRMDGNPIYYDNELLPISKGNVTLFLSSNNQKSFAFLNNSGYYATSSYVLYNQANYFMNSLLGVRYWYGNPHHPIVHQLLGVKKINNKQVPIYENPYALSFGYMVNENRNISYQNDPFQYQNEITEAILGEAIFTPLKMKKIENNTYEIESDANDLIYMYIESEAKLEFYDIYANIYVNDILVQSENVMETIFTIQHKHPNEKIKMQIEYLTKLDYEPKIYAYKEDSKHNLQLLKQLQQKQLQEVKIEKNKLKGIIETNQDGLLMLTIPYEKGFTVFVDGHKTRYEEMYHTFIGIPLEKGKHTIIIQYEKPYGGILGLGISIGTMIWIAGYQIFSKKILYVKKSKV